MLEQMRGVEEVGWYRAPVLVLEGLTLVPRIFGYALIPTMAALYPTAPESVTALCRRGMKYLLLIGLPMAAFGLIAARPFVAFLFGPTTVPASTPRASSSRPSPSCSCPTSARPHSPASTAGGPSSSSPPPASCSTWA